jgi:hypothetical protein
MTQRKIVLPIIHMNGTSACDLVRVRDEAYLKIQEALESMRQVAPNGRDYYPEPGRMVKAEEQHRRRCRVLSDLLEELDEEIGLLNGGQSQGFLG